MLYGYFKAIETLISGLRGWTGHAKALVFICGSVAGGTAIAASTVGADAITAEGATAVSRIDPESGEQTGDLSGGLSDRTSVFGQPYGTVSELTSPRPMADWLLTTTMAL